MRSLLSIILALSCPLLLVAADAPFLSQSDNGVIRKAILVDAATLTPEYALNTARAFLAENEGRFSLLLLVVGSDAAELRVSLWQGTGQASIESSVKEIERVGKPSGPIARLLATRLGAVFDFRSSTRKVHQIIRGKDPTHLRLGSASFELLHFAVEGSGAQSRRTPRVLSVFLKGPQPLPAQAVSAAVDFFRQVTGFDWVGVHARSDYRFSTDRDFPLFFRFGETYSSGTAFEFQGASSVSCLRIPSLRGCSGQNFIP